MAFRDPRIPKRRGNPMFVKGNKLGGRPKGSVNGATRAKQWMEQEGGWERIISVANGTCTGSDVGFNKQYKVRGQFMVWLAERAYGKAHQAVQLTGKNGEPIETTNAQRFDLSKVPTPVLEKLMGDLGSTSP